MASQVSTLRLWRCHRPDRRLSRVRLRQIWRLGQVVEPGFAVLGVKARTHHRPVGVVVLAAHDPLEGADEGGVRSGLIHEDLRLGRAPPAEMSARRRLGWRAQHLNPAARPGSRLSPTRSATGRCRGFRPHTPRSSRCPGRRFRSRRRNAQRRSPVPPGLSRVPVATDVALGDVIALMVTLGNWLRLMGRQTRAQSVLEKALSLAQNAYGADSPSAAMIMHDLGNAIRDTGDLRAARVALDRAIAIIAGHLVPDAPTLVAMKMHLALILAELGEAETAVGIFRWALPLVEQEYGDKHPEFATAMNNMASAMYAEGKDFRGAKDLINRSLLLTEHLFGPTHPEVASRLNTLGQILNSLGNHQDARVAFERAVLVLRSHLGAEHQSVAVLVANLGDTSLMMGEGPRAIREYRRALEAFENRLGADHAYTVETRQKLAEVRRAVMGK
jgi:tetratricopeptide (TPR) repeat protein